MIRLPRYKLPVDEDLPSVLSVEFRVVENQRFDSYELHLHSNVPLKEVVALFREIEQNLNYQHTASHKDAIKVSSSQIVQEIKVWSLKSFEPITRLPTPIVLKIWDLLIRSRVV